MKRIDDSYNVVTIGSGMAGLSCGLILAKEGKSVCILEKNAQIGGTLQTFKRDGAKFDTGVHYAGGLEEGQPLYPYFNYLDIFKDVELKKLDVDGYDRISFDGDEVMYAHAQGYDNFKKLMSSYKFVKGGSQISRSLNYSIKGLGGTVRNAEFTSIDHDDKQVSSVTVKGGRVIKVETFISNVHPSFTLGLMDTSLIRKSYVKHIRSIENSISVFTLYLVLKPKAIKTFNYNRYHFSSPDVWTASQYKEKNWGEDLAILGMPDPKDPEYAGVMCVMAYMRIEEMRPWMDSFNTTTDVDDLGQAYLDFKDRKAKKLHKKADELIPELIAATQSYHTSTPLTQRDYLNVVDGGLYGIARDHNEPLKSQINTRTKMKNLYFTGQNIILHGVLGATISSIVTCGEIIGKEYLVNKIRQYK